MEPTSQEEEHLITQAKEGDLTSFERLISSVETPLYHFIKRQVSHEEETLGIAQEVLIKAFHKIELFRGDTRFKIWVMKIALNECKNFHRNRLQKSLHHGSGADAAAQKLETAEAKEKIHLALSMIDPTYSQPLILFHLQGLKHQEIAKILGIPLGTVKTRIFRGHKVLAEKLKKSGLFETTAQAHTSKGKA